MTLSNKNIQIKILIFISIFFFIVENHNFLIELKTNKISEELSIITNDNNITIYRKSINNKIFKLDKKDKYWIIENEYLNKIIINIPKNILHKDFYLNIMIGDKSFKYNKNYFIDKWKISKIKDKQYFESPIELCFDQSKIFFFNKIINWSGDRFLYKRILILFIRLLILFILTFILFKYIKNFRALNSKINKIFDFVFINRQIEKLFITNNQLPPAELGV